MNSKVLYLLIGTVIGVFLGATFVHTTRVKDLKFALDQAYIPLSAQAYQWTGFAKEIGDNYLVAEFDVIVREFPTPKNPNNRELRTVKLFVDNETQIVKFGVPVGQPDGAGGEIFTAPEISASLAEIQPGSYLEVTIEGDFKTVTEAKARKIIIVGN